MRKISKERYKRENEIRNKFRKNIYFEDLMEEYQISLQNLKHILKTHIKGNYDYDRILSSFDSQKQFNIHLNHRWNPLSPEEPWEEIPAYLGKNGIIHSGEGITHPSEMVLETDEEKPEEKDKQLE